MKLNLIALLLIAVVALSGCTMLGIQQGGMPGGLVGPGTAGVVITGFSPDISTVEKNIPIVFTLTVHNKGEKKATNVGTQLFGIVQGSEWTLSSLTTIPTTLEGADPSRGFEGEASSAQWQATPQVSKAVDTEYSVVARVYYTYNTVSSSLVKVATSDYLRSIGGSADQFGLVSSQTTGGPLSVTVKMWAPVVTTGTTTTRVQFEISNIGGGRVFTDTPTAVPTVANLDMISITAGTGLKCPTTSPKLVNNKAVITCDLNIATASSQGFAQISFELTINYNYFVDQSATVKVLRTS
jgi:hypothetical protein